MASRRPRGGGADVGPEADDGTRPDAAPPEGGADDDAPADPSPGEPGGTGPDGTEASARGDGSDDDGTGPRAAGRPTRLLDARTLAICALVALIAALAAGLVVSRLTAGGEDDGETISVGELTPAVEVPDVALTRFDGTEVTLGDYRGQPLVVNFWGAWCQPCVEEMPDLQEVHAALGEQVTFVGVNVRDEPEAALALAERTGVTYDLVRDLDGELGRALEVTTWPTTVLVLPDGTVVDSIQRKVSAEALCEKVGQSLLGGNTEACA